MISRIYVIPKVEDVREKLYKNSWESISASIKISKVRLVSSYLIEGDLKDGDIIKIAEALTNKNIEEYSVNKIPELSFDYLIEIGFLPGVTDNVGHTTEDTICDLLHLKQKDSVKVYTSQVFLINGKVKDVDIKSISLALHNPLIERALVLNPSDVKKGNLPLQTPKVKLSKKTDVVEISLDLEDKKLEEIGKLGIKDKDGSYRGPLALDLNSMKVIKDYFNKLKRNPNDIELESLAQTWSEHCKHTIFANPIDEVADGLYKRYIKGATNLIRKQKGNKDFCVSVFSDNSGAIAFDKDYLITHKVETHNSPSALDPFGGAITGIVGVNRDCLGFGLGAKPVANLYGFCFGNPYDKRALYRDKELRNKMLSPKRIMDGVIKGINSGGNCSGIPTVSGFVKYDDRYRGKPLVFAGTVGLIPRKIGNKLSHEKSAMKGDYVVVIGGRVGADGIHGATFSSVVMDSSSPATAVQIGDPITEKKFSDALVKEARDMNLYTSITDNGAGGLSCSVAEMAKECGGAIVNLEKVPLKYPNMEPWQIWISESQERMTLSVPKDKWLTFKNLMNKRGVEATVIGEFNNSKNMTVKWNGKKIMEIPLDFLHDGLPKQHLTTKEFVPDISEPILKSKTNLTQDLENLLKDKNIAGHSFVSSQYDHEVQASSVIKPVTGKGRINTDAQVFRPVLSSKKGVILSTSTYPSYGDISTYDMSICAIDTVVRNSICVGGSISNLAILDNFCWCSSNEEERLWQLHEALKACYDGATFYGTPFISGKDSMFNDFKGYDEKGNSIKISVPPTLLISSIGVIDDVYKTITPEFKKKGDVIYLLGDTDNELGGSEYFKMISNNNTSKIGTITPKVDLEKNIKTYKALENAISRNLIDSATPINSGGLAIALAKSAVGGMLGCEISIKNIKGDAKEAYQKLFSESQGRIIVSVSPKNLKKFESLMNKISYSKIGKVLSTSAFSISDRTKVVNTDINKLKKLYHDFSNKMK
ncbi:MAG: phosphoribosylformylglycinamidine synthase subunit PurSL [Patescibacteria group bacterium]|nr:phosphoribosylformylglycinamidine synthase subunit PurSL [Patescibacteria group bacterium]